MARKLSVVEFDQYVSNKASMLRFDVTNKNKFFESYLDFFEMLIANVSLLKFFKITEKGIQDDYSMKVVMANRFNSEESVAFFIPPSNGRAYPTKYIDEVVITYKNKNLTSSILGISYSLYQLFTGASEIEIKLVLGETTKDLQFSGDIENQDELIQLVTDDHDIVKKSSEFVFSNLLDYLDFQQNYVEKNGYCYNRNIKLYNDGNLILDFASI